MKRVIQMSLMILLLLFTITIGATLGAHFFFKKHQNVIFSGIRIEGHDFSGLTKKEARKRLKEVVNPFLKKTIVLEGRNDSWLLQLSEIELDFKTKEALNEAFGIGREGNLLQRSIDVWETAKYGQDLDLKLTYNREKLKDKLVKISEEINIKSRNAHLDLSTNKIVEARRGQVLNIEASRERIISRLSNLEALPIKLVIDDKEFRVNKEKLKSLGLTNQISSYQTKFDSSEKNRVGNIKLASKKINGTLLKPGEAFSFNKVVGPRTLEKGFNKAMEIVNHEYVTGVGGGICQVSSTLYNAVLLGDFEVLERQNHSRPVSYVPLGRGATVYYDYLDFKFKNDSSVPIMILSEVNTNKLKINIMGKSKEYKVKILTSDPEVIEYDRKKKVDPDLEDDQRKLVREGKNGYRVTVKKKVLVDSQVIRNEIISKDVYQPIDEVIKVSDK